MLKNEMHASMNGGKEFELATAPFSSGGKGLKGHIPRTAIKAVLFPRPQAWYFSARRAPAEDWVTAVLLALTGFFRLGATCLHPAGPSFPNVIWLSA